MYFVEIILRNIDIILMFAQRAETTYSEARIQVSVMWCGVGGWRMKHPLYHPHGTQPEQIGWIISNFPLFLSRLFQT